MLYLVEIISRDSQLETGVPDWLNENGLFIEITGPFCIPCRSDFSLWTTTSIPPRTHLKHSLSSLLWDSTVMPNLRDFQAHSSVRGWTQPVDRLASWRSQWRTRSPGLDLPRRPGKGSSSDLSCGCQSSSYWLHLWPQGHESDRPRYGGPLGDHCRLLWRCHTVGHHFECLPNISPVDSFEPLITTTPLPWTFDSDFGKRPLSWFNHHGAWNVWNMNELSWTTRPCKIDGKQWNFPKSLKSVVGKASACRFQMTPFYVGEIWRDSHEMKPRNKMFSHCVQSIARPLARLAVE